MTLGNLTERYLLILVLFFLYSKFRLYYIISRDSTHRLSNLLLLNFFILGLNIKIYCFFNIFFLFDNTLFGAIWLINRLKCIDKRPFPIYWSTWWRYVFLVNFWFFFLFLLIIGEEVGYSITFLPWWWNSGILNRGSYSILIFFAGFISFRIHISFHTDKVCWEIDLRWLDFIYNST